MIISVDFFVFRLAKGLMDLLIDLLFKIGVESLIEILLKSLERLDLLFDVSNKTQFLGSLTIFSVKEQTFLIELDSLAITSFGYLKTKTKIVMRNIFYRKSKFWGGKSNSN